MLILKFHIPLPVVHAQLKQPQKSVASVTAANEAIKYQQDFKGLAMRECYKGKRKFPEKEEESSEGGSAGRG